QILIARRLRTDLLLEEPRLEPDRFESPRGDAHLIEKLAPEADAEDPSREKRRALPRRHVADRLDRRKPRKPRRVAATELLGPEAMERDLDPTQIPDEASDRELIRARNREKVAAEDIGEAIVKLSRVGHRLEDARLGMDDDERAVDRRRVRIATERRRVID